MSDESESANIQELIDQLDPASRTFYAEALIGKDAQEFFSSDLGRYMLGCAKQDMEDAYVKLKSVSPFRWRRVRELQNQVVVAERFILYIRDLILRGKAAELALEERDDG